MAETSRFAEVAPAIEDQAPDPALRISHWYVIAVVAGEPVEEATLDVLSLASKAGVPDVAHNNKSASFKVITPPAVIRGTRTLRTAESSHPELSSTVTLTLPDTVYVAEYVVPAPC